MRFETAPGEQAQMDWGHFGNWDGQRLYGFALTLGWSRMQYVEFTQRQDVETLLNCMVHAFDFFGGVTTGRQPQSGDKRTCGLSCRAILCLRCYLQLALVTGTGRFTVTDLSAGVSGSYNRPRVAKAIKGEVKKNTPPSAGSFLASQPT